jgi:hypothetical protein
MPHDQTLWLNEAVDLVPDIAQYRAEVREYLEPLLKRCRATSKHRFWMWLRQQLIKTEDSEYFLQWMQESRCPAEADSSQSDPQKGFEHTVNGDIALIAVGDEHHHAVWKIPVAHLEWALSLFPVTLKRLPQLELPQLKEIRRLRLKLQKSPWFSAAVRQTFLDEIADLETEATRTFDPAPRYSLVKSIDGRQRAVHRLFLGVDDICEVQAINDDFLDFTSVPYRVTVTPVPMAGLAVGKYRRPPQVEIVEDVMIPNLQIVNSLKVQKDFEESHLQVKLTPYGDPQRTLRVQPNASWKTGVCGHIADCGPSAPITPEEATMAGLDGVEVRSDIKADVAALRRKWKVPRAGQGWRPPGKK